MRLLATGVAMISAIWMASAMAQPDNWCLSLAEREQISVRNREISKTFDLASVSDLGKILLGFVKEQSSAHEILQQCLDSRNFINVMWNNLPSRNNRLQLCRESIQRHQRTNKIPPRRSPRSDAYRSWHVPLLREALTDRIVQQRVGAVSTSPKDPRRCRPS